MAFAVTNAFLAARERESERERERHRERDASIVVLDKEG